MSGKSSDARGPSSESNQASSDAGRLYALFEQTAVGLAEAALDGRFIRASSRYCEMVGRSLDELLAIRMQDITDPQHLPENLLLFGRLLETGEAFDIEKRYLRPDGSGVWVHNSVSLIRDEHGAPQSVLAVSVDISKSKGAEAALRQNEERLRLVQAVGEIGSFDYDLVNDQAVCSPEYYRLMGLPEGHPINRETWVNAIHPDDREQALGALDAAIRGRKPFSFDYRIVRADTGEVRWVSGRAAIIFDANDQPARFIGGNIDFSDRVSAEQALRETSQRLNAIINNTEMAIFMMDYRQQCVFMNRAAEELTGYRFEETQGRPLHDVIHYLYPDGRPYPLAECPIDRAFPENDQVQGEEIFVHKDGHFYPVGFTASPIRNEAGEPIGTIIEARNVSEDKRAKEAMEEQSRTLEGLYRTGAALASELQRANETLEQRVEERTRELEHANEALRQAQKMEAIGQLTGGIAHDFNNMLTVIRGSTDVLRRKDLPDAKRERYIDAIADTSDRAARLTSQLLAFARRQALKPETFDAAERVQAISEMLRTVLGSRVRLSIDARCDDCFIEADSSQFETAIVNMAVNARDAMDGEGDLAISIETRKSLPGHLRPEADDAFVTVTVTDSGHGIARENIDKIFEPFFTTKDVGRGTGLGLSQVYGFAKQSGGEIDVVSEVGQGSTFMLYLPKVAEPSRPLARKSDTAPVARGGGRVLVVEDNREVGTFAEQVLADLGYRTTLAASAAEALAILDKDGPFDLVFSDVVMPGMSGIEFAEQLRRQSPKLPVVLTSGYSHVLAEGAGHGYPLLHKPYSLEALAQILSEALAN